MIVTQLAGIDVEESALRWSSNRAQISAITDCQFRAAPV
jgi:hypothetical protein